MEFSGRDQEGRAGTGVDAPTSLEVLSLVGRGGVGDIGGLVQLGECSILPWSRQSEGRNQGERLATLATPLLSKTYIHVFVSLVMKCLGVFCL